MTDRATAADVQRHEFDLPDGRRLEAYLTGWAGAPENAPVLVDHHGTPGCGLPMRVLREQAVARGVRVISPSRPGYGASTPHPGRTVAAVAADVTHLLDRLDVGQAAVTGASGGGPHALATAALLPGRVTSVATIASVGPFAAAGLDFMAGMGQDNLDEFAAALAGSGQLRAYLDADRPALLHTTAPEIAEALASLLPPVDRAELTGAFAEDVVAGFSAGLAPGIEGWLDDDLAFTQDWGFELTSLAAVPVSLWQGDLDLMVPATHGRWLAGAIPHARVHLLPEDGHLSIFVGRLGEVLDELLLRP